MESKFYKLKPLQWEDRCHLNGGRFMHVATTRVGDFRVFIGWDDKWWYVIPGFDPMRCHVDSEGKKYCQREHDTIAASLMEEVPVETECGAD